MKLFPIAEQRKSLDRSLFKGIVFFGLLIAVLWFIGDDNGIPPKVGHILALVACFVAVFIGIATQQLAKECGELRIALVRLNTEHKLVKGDPELSVIREAYEIIDALDEDGVDIIQDGSD